MYIYYVRFCRCFASCLISFSLFILTVVVVVIVPQQLWVVQIHSRDAIYCSRNLSIESLCAYVCRCVCVYCLLSRFFQSENAFRELGQHLVANAWNRGSTLFARIEWIHTCVRIFPSTPPYLVSCKCRPWHTWYPSVLLLCTLSAFTALSLQTPFICVRIGQNRLPNWK